MDHVVDVDLGGNLAATLGSVRENGSIAYYATNGALKPEIDLRALMGRNLTVRGFVLPTSPHATRKRAQSDIAAFIRSPGRMLSVAGEFPLLRDRRRAPVGRSGRQGRHRRRRMCTLKSGTRS